MGTAVIVVMRMVIMMPVMRMIPVGISVRMLLFTGMTGILVVMFIMGAVILR